MDLKEAISLRHSVRTYSSTPLPLDICKRLQDEIDVINEEADLHFQFVRDNPVAFDNFMAHYGRFKGVRSYICCIGEKTPSLYARVGYYGERLVLLARSLGIDSCWAAMTYDKKHTACTV